MASKIDYWDEDRRERVQSEREYETFEVFGKRVTWPGDTFDRGESAETIILYLDVESGAVAHDLAAHERSFKP